MPISIQRLTMLVFFLQPIAFGSWLPRIPEVQSALGLGPAGLALVLLGLPCGTLLTLPFAGPIVGRIGARAAIRIGNVLYAMAVSLPAFAGNPVLLFITLALVGSTISFLELGLNVQADRVEKATGSLIMSTSHGFWSLGIMAGSLIGSGFAALAVPPTWAIMLVAAFVLAAGLAVAQLLPDYGADPVAATTASEPSSAAWRLPGTALLGICLFTFGVTMTEGAMADWSAIFLRDMLGAGNGLAGLGYSVFALCVAAARFGGDRLKARFGAVTLARGCVSLALVGIGLLAFASSLPFALVGFGIIGLGASVGFPLAVTAAAGLTEGTPSANVAVLSFVALLGFLVGPPIIGFVAQVIDLRIGLATLVPFLILSLTLTGRLRSRRGPAGVH
jgi:MFS family permease